MSPKWKYEWSSPRTSGRARLGKCTYGIWNEEAYQLLLEVQVLYGIRQEADPDSLRAAEVEEEMREIPVSSGTIDLVFNAFEVKTLVIRIR